jgi:hypothetical protein
MMQKMMIINALLALVLGYNGKSTFYYNENNAPGSCGFGFSDSEFIAALSGDMMKGYKAPYCNRLARVEYKGKSITVKIVDTCPTCENTSLDLSPTAFRALEDLDVGLIDIKWEFLPNGAKEAKKVDNHSKKVGNHPKKVGSHSKKVENQPKKVGNHPKKVGSHSKKVENQPKKVGNQPKKVDNQPKKVDNQNKKGVNQTKKGVNQTQSESVKNDFDIHRSGSAKSLAFSSLFMLIVFCV